MLDWLFSLVAPHLCVSCGRNGRVFCDCCKKSILKNRISSCVLCQKKSVRGVCAAHKQSFSRAYVVDYRQGVLKDALSLYKFDAARGCARDLAQLLSEVMPKNLSKDTLIVAIPTIPAHIRQRGFGHAELLAKHLARSLKRTYCPLLQRQEYSVQKNASRHKRSVQAQQAFCLHKKSTRAFLRNKDIVLVDDVFTTGSSANAAAELFCEAGARTVSIAILARQPLDKSKKI